MAIPELACLLPTNISMLAAAAAMRRNAACTARRWNHRLPQFASTNTTLRTTAPFSTAHLPQRLRLLVVECYDRAGRERIASVGCRKASDIFASLLHKLAPAGCVVDLDFIHPAESASHVLEVSELQSYHGVVWTGSSLSVTDDVPEVSQRASERAGVWGLAQRLFVRSFVRSFACS